MPCHKLIILKGLVKVSVMAYTEPKRLNGGERSAVSAKLSNRKFNTVVMSLIKAA